MHPYKDLHKYVCSQCSICDSQDLIKPKIYSLEEWTSIAVHLCSGMLASIKEKGTMSAQHNTDSQTQM